MRKILTLYCLFSLVFNIFANDTIEKRKRLHHEQVQSHESRYLYIAEKIVNSSFKHFIRKDLIAEGNFGVVYKVQHRTTMSLYAMKEVSIATERTKKQFLNEVNVHEIMKSAHAAFTVPLLCTFQTPPLESGAFGYMVFPLMSGGDFSDFLSAHQKREKPLLESEVRFYAANMILAIEELHNHNIIHADIKPENFCWAMTDWWSMGIIIYKMFGGKTEQSNENRKTSSPELLADNYGITEGTSSESLVHNSESLQLLENTKPVVINISTNWPKDAQDLLKNLLNTNYRKRLGVKGAEQIKKHPFFKETNWETLREKQVVAPVWPVMHKDIIIYTETITGQTFPSY
uniref:Serine/threonine-protein kinase greatwall n=1 Tax=Ditylenchus dipsaci TaxID=166011 RepID=A0A915DEJ7_9BILA